MYNPYESLGYQEPSIPQLQTQYQPIGDNATPEEGFAPEYSEKKLRDLIKLYKSNPKVINSKMLDKMQKHAVYYNVPFYTGDFSILGALSELGKGLFSGFTTLEIGDPPDNEYEAIVRNLGHLIGFAPGLMAKPLKLLGFANQARSIAGIRSVPMKVADFVTKKTKNTISNVSAGAIARRGDAAQTAGKFLTGGAVKHVAEGAFHLGVASAASSWQQGIDGMIHGGLGGAKFGGAFAALGNIVPGKGGGSYILRALAGSLFQGLPATQRGATTPEQVYEYMLGAYFGGGAVGWVEKATNEFFVKKTKQAYGTEPGKADHKLLATNDPRLVKGWSELDPAVKKSIEKEFKDPKSNHYDPDAIGENLEETPYRTVQQEFVIKTLGLHLDKVGNPTKESWQSLNELALPAKKRTGLANKTEKDLIEVRENKEKITEDLRTLRKALKIAKKDEKIIIQEDIRLKTLELERENTFEKELLKLKPYEFFEEKAGKRTIQVEPRADGNDIGMFNRRDLTRKSEQFVEENLSEIWDNAKFSPQRKAEEKIRLTAVIDDVITKPEYFTKGQKVNMTKLKKDIVNTIKREEGIKVKIDKETEDGLRQWLTRNNFGKIVKQLNVSLDYKGNIIEKDIEIRGEDGFTLAGNRAQNLEPVKLIQTIFETMVPPPKKGQAAPESHILFDNITIRAKDGSFKDIKLSHLRKNLKVDSKSEKIALEGREKYDSIIRKVHDKMAKDGFYPFGGKGDSDIIMYVKLHPHLKNKKITQYVKNSITKAVNKSKNAKHHIKGFLTAMKRNKFFTEEQAKEQYISNLLWDISLNGFKPKSQAGYSRVINKLFFGEGFIKNATAWNKRNQIWFTPAWAADKALIKKFFDEASLGLPTLKVNYVTTPIIGEGGKVVAAQTDYKNNQLLVNKKEAAKTFKDKVWTKPKIKGVKPLPLDSFRTVKEWIDFQIAHERARFTRQNKRIKNIAERENHANKLAMQSFEQAKKFNKSIKNGKLRYIIARDLDPALFKKVKGVLKRIKKLDKNSLNTEHGEHVDGQILVEDTVLDAIIRDSGMPDSGQSKSFIVSPDAVKGALLGKYMMHSAGPEASRMMRENGLHMIMQESAAKQTGERKLTDYKVNPLVLPQIQMTSNQILKAYNKYIREPNWSVDAKKDIIRIDHFKKYDKATGKLLEDKFDPVQAKTQFADYMRKDKGINVIYDKATDTFKDATTRQIPKHLEIDDIKRIYELPIEDIKYAYNVKQDTKMAGYIIKDGKRIPHHHHIPKQLLMAMAQNTFSKFPKSLVDEFYTETVLKRFNGNEEYNEMVGEYLKNPKDKLRYNILEKNIDKLGIQQLLDILNGPPTPLTDAAYFKLMKINKEAIAERVAEGEITPEESDAILNNINEFNSVVDRITNAAIEVKNRERLAGREGNVNSMLLHQYMRKYRFNVIKNYVFDSISKPKIGNSGMARMRGFDKFFQADPEFQELNHRDDIFFLDNSFHNMPLRTFIKGYENTTLGKFWHDYKNNTESKIYKSKDAEEVLKATTVRVPMDSVSGAQVLKFAGFTGRKGHGILMHARAMRAEGGADLDGDEAFIFFGGRKGGKGGGFKKEWAEAFEANKREYEKADGTTPDRKQGKVPKIDKTYEEYLTKEDSIKETGIDPEWRDGPFWKYDSGWREELSGRAVDGRNDLSVVSNMTQTMKASHNAMLYLKGQKQTIEVKIPDPTNPRERIKIKVTIKPKTDEKELTNARQLASSMIAFTSDPLDVAGLKGTSDYFRKLHKAFFDVSVPKKHEKKFNALSDDAYRSLFLNNKSILGQMTEFNSALFGRNYSDNRSWTAGDIAHKTRFIADEKTFGAEEDISHTMLPKLARLAHRVDLRDKLFHKISRINLNKMYRDHENIIKNFPEMSEIVDNLEVPQSRLITDVLRSKVYTKMMYDAVANNFDWFKKVIRNSQYAQGKKYEINLDYYSDKVPRDVRVARRKRILDKLLNFAENIITQDVTDMVSYRMVWKYYDGKEVNKTLFRKMLKEANSIRRESYLARENVGAPKEASEEVQRSYFGGPKVPTGKNRARLLDQSKVDKRISDFKKTLPNNRAIKLFDMLLLGSYRHGTKQTSLTKIGLASKAVDKDSVVEFLGEFNTIMNKAIKPKETKTAEELFERMEKGDMMEMEKDSPVTLARTILKDTTTGYEGLHGKPDMKKLPKEVRQELTELVENLDFYGNKVKKDLNLIVRGILQKDLNTLNFADFKTLNNYFKELRGGTFWQRLFGDKGPHPELKRRYWFQFPATVGRETMKYDIELLKKRGLFTTKTGEHVGEGDIAIPTNFMEKLQHGISIAMDAAQSKGDEEVGRLRRELDFIGDLSDGESLRQVAVRKIEKANASKTFDEVESFLGKEWAKTYLDLYKKTVNEVDYNSLRNKKYMITNKDGKRVEMSGEQIVNDITKVYKNFFDGMHKIIVGNKEFTERYIKTNKKGEKMYWDIADYKKFPDRTKPMEPVYDYKKVMKDIYEAYNRGEDLTLHFGIDGLRQIARSMMIRLHDYKKQQYKSRFELRKEFELPRPTNKIEEGYWPHMFFDKTIAWNAMKKAIDKIEKSNLPKEDKEAEIEKILYRSKSLTGDWIIGTENWESYDNALNNIKAHKKTDKVNWFNHSQMTGSMHKRTSHIPGWSIDATVAETYGRNVYKVYYKQMAQLFSRNILQEFDNMALRKNWDKVDYDKGRSLMDRWSDYYKLYIQDAMGHPSVIPDHMINDPGMRLKGTPYAWWADNKVKDRVNSIAKNLGIKSKIEGLERFDLTDIMRWSNLEAKFELMSLLAHPKSMINNLFGGTMHTIQSTGFPALRKARDYNFLRTINPEWTSNQAVLDFVIKQGVFPEMLMHEWGLQKELQTAKAKAFLKDVGKRLNSKGEIDKKTFREIASEHKVTAPIMKAASKFMSVPEMALRRDAFMSHYIKAWERFGGAITQYDHPFLIEMAKKGVKATQFLYSAPFRPAFSRTALGKIMTRFHLWSWNSFRFRNDVIREARIRGYRAGTPEYEKFKRTAEIDLLVYGLASIYTMSLFENVLPAPLNHIKETSEWLFGDEKERNRAFFGAWPTAIAPLQIVTPPIARFPLSLLKTLTDDNYDKFLDYHIYTMFPFGRIARDIAPFAPGNILDNPYRAIEKFTGIPYGDFQRKRRELKEEGSYHPLFPSIAD